jgi:halimadienyl-diphosphate synthase
MGEMSKNGLIYEFGNLLEQVGTANVSPSAYDTAWVARIPHPTNPKNSAFPEALVWLNSHQHADGSWGEGGIPERILATIATIIALAEKGQRASDKELMEQGLAFIWDCLFKLETYTVLPIGFELLLGVLVDEAKTFDIALPEWLASHFEAYRRDKLNLLQHVKPAQFRNTSAIFSAEFLGTNLPAQPDNYISDNGSVGISPAATASVLRSIFDTSSREKMLTYLKSKAIPDNDGYGLGWGDITDIDLFEAIWALYNLILCNQQNHPILQPAIKKALKLITNAWTELGLGPSSASLALYDSDDTSVGYTILKKFGLACDLTVLEDYWRDDHLLTYKYERDPSLSANIHGLEAYELAGNSERVESLLKFIDKRRNGMPYWVDKWHASPYYITSHTVLIAGKFDKTMVKPAVEWLLHTQRKNGAWGCEGDTAEETAYAVQALLSYNQLIGGSNKLTVAAQLGIRFLRQTFQPYILEVPPLWVSKNRYAPRLVVRSAVLSALILGEIYHL